MSFFDLGFLGSSQERPIQERPSRIFDDELLRYGPRSEPQTSPREQVSNDFTRAILEASGQLSRELTGTTPQESQPQVDAAIQEAIPEDLFGPDALNLGFRRGWQMVLAGVGEFEETAAQLAQDNSLIGKAVQQYGMTPEHLQQVESYGRGLKEEAIARRAYLAQQQPEGVTNWAMGVIGEMVPMMVAAGAGAATGGGLSASLGTAFGVSYFIEKAFLQDALVNEYEIDYDEADRWATIAAVPIAALEAAFEASVAAGAADDLAGKGVNTAIKKTLLEQIAGIAKGAGRGAYQEGITEALQENIGIITELAASGERIDAMDFAYRLGASAAAGAVGGGTFGGAFGFAGEVLNEYRTRVSAQDEQVQAMAAASFDPAAAPVGTTVAGRTKKVRADGVEYWVKEGTSTFAKAPTREEVQKATLQTSRDVELEEATDLATTETTPINLPIQDEVARVLNLSPERKGTTPEQVELNIRTLALRYVPRALRSGYTTAELDTEIATIEALALDEASDLKYADRISLLARKRAMEYTKRSKLREGGGVEALDVTSGARRYAEMDAETFRVTAAALDASNNEAAKRMISEARAIRDAENQVTGSSKATRRLIQEARTKRSRGLTKGSMVVTSEGPAQVHDIRKTGFLEVLVEGQDMPRVVDPADVEIIPDADTQVELTTGEAVTVLGMSDEGQILIRLPNGSSTVITIGEVESIVDLDGPPVPVEEVAETQDIGTPVPAIDTQTGKSVEIAKVGKDVVETTEGQQIPRSSLSFSTPDQRSIADFRRTGQIPTFQAGVQPSEGKHINFLRVPKDLNGTFKNIIRSGVPVVEAVKQVKARTTILPQPSSPNYVTYAIELPTEGRKLSDAAKRLLGYIGGKDVKVYRNTLQASVSLNKDLQDADVGLMSVPASLTSVLDYTAMDREYLKRALDLGFEALSPRVTTILERTQQIAAEAADAVIGGDPGRAEVLEIEARVANLEAIQAIFDETDLARRDVWDAVEYELQEEMQPLDPETLDILNELTVEELEDIPGVGSKIANSIIEHRDQTGGFNTLTQIQEVRGVGPKVNTAIMKALREGSWTGANARLADKRATNLIETLRALPGRTKDRLNSFLPAFSHNEIPGMLLVIDKETITGASRATRDVETRDIYHIEFIMPDGKVDRSRTIGTDTNPNVLVPASLAETPGNRGTPPAIEMINSMLLEGMPLADAIVILEDMRGKTTRVRLEDGTEAVVAGKSRGSVERAARGQPAQRISFEEAVARQRERDAGGTPEPIRKADPPLKPSDERAVQREMRKLGTGMLTLVDDKGNMFEYPAEKVTPLGETDEAMVPIPVATKLTEEEALNEVLREVREFRGRAGAIAVGEWTTNAPGIYATIHPTTTGFRASILREPLSKTRRRPVLYDETMKQDFGTREEAEEWLDARNFFKTSTTHNNAVADLFAGLPQEFATTPLLETEGILTKILSKSYKQRYVHQPIRDYALRFAEHWYNTAPDNLINKPGGLFGDWRYRRLVDIYDPRDLQRSTQRSGEITQTVPNTPRMDIVGGRILMDKPTAGELANDIRVFDGVLMDKSLRANDPEVVKTAKDLHEQTEHRERFLDMIEVDGLPAFEQIEKRLVRVGGELGIILDSQPGSNSLVVQTFSDGQPVIRTVPKKSARRVRDPRTAFNYYRSARDSLGELITAPRTPEQGLSVLDRKLGVQGLVETEDGTGRAEYIKGLGKRISTILRSVKIAKDGNITGNVDLIENLRDAWIRMHELGIKNSDLPADQRIPTPLIGKPRVGHRWPLLTQLAYEEIRGQYSNGSAYGDLVARVKLGLTDKKKLSQINKQAKEAGIDPSLPDFRKVEELIANVWDPATADLLYQINREAGFLWFGRGAHDPHYGLELRMPASASVVRLGAFNGLFLTPREAANRHPTLRHAIHLWEKSRTNYGNTVKRGLDIIGGLQGWRSGTTLERKQFIWSLLENEKLAERMTRPADLLSKQDIEDALGDDALPNWDWYKHYETIRGLLIEGRRMGIRNALVRGFHPKPLQFNKDATPDEKLSVEQKLRQDNDLTAQEARAIKQAADAGHVVYDLDRTSNPAYARPRDEVERFLDLLEEYEALVDIPSNIHQSMLASKDGWMAEEFDFWSRYGIKNYAPHILQGRHKIKLVDPDGGDDRVVAFAPDATTAMEFVLRASNGRIPGVPASGEFYFEMGKAIADDIDMEFLGPARFRTFYGRMAKEWSGKKGMGAKVAREAVRALKLGRERALPRDLHTQARTNAALVSTIEDPYQRILMYWGRTARNNFLLDVEDAYEQALNIDADVSRAEGVASITGGQAHRYLRALRDSFMGRPTDIDRTVNRALGVVTGITKLGPAKLARLKSQMNNPDYDVWNDPEFLDFLYNEDYTARRWAESATTLQSFWRLGLNFAGAAINSTQHLMHTPAWLVSEGVSVADAWRFSLAGYSDMIKYFEEQRAGGTGPLSQLIHDAGTVTVPARGIAGPGLGMTGERAPLFFSDDSWLQSGDKMIKWAAMLPFAGAERSVRLASTFAGARAAESLGIEGEAKVAFARRTVDNTQFQYYDQALPPFMRGSAARVLFQFQQFPLNAIKYEKDMILGFLPAGLRPSTMNSEKAASARKAWAVYNATGLVAGGAAWFASRPALALLTPLAKQLGYDNLESMIVFLYDQLFGGGQEDRERENYGAYVGDPELLTARGMALYGLPGLASLNLSQRLGVSGLDFNPSRATDILLGPTGSMYADLASLYRGSQTEAGIFNVDKRGGALLAGGSLAISALASRSMPGAIPLPLATLAAASTFDVVGDIMGEDLMRFFNNTRVGARFKNSMSPTLARGIINTYDVFFDSSPYETFDMNDQRRLYRPGFGTLFESFTSLVGLQTIEESEERALRQYMIGRIDSRQRLRSTFIEMAAKVRGNPEEITKIFAMAVEAGAPITMPDVEAYLARRREGAIERTKARAPVFMRGDDRLSPTRR